jgi:peptidoglycan/LPS O-acetylase OafA/YrhL
VMQAWPEGTAHYWTLAIQIQFYIFWPLFIFLTPPRLLVGGLFFVITLAPFSRWVLSTYFPQIIHSQAITITAMDYLGMGSLLALAIERGVKVGNIHLRTTAWVSFAAYVLLYVLNDLNRPLEGFSYFQQTFLAVSFAGLISASLLGIGGLWGRLLEHPFLQTVGRLSYGLYLYHNVSPLLLGYILPWLWHPFFTGPWVSMRILAFALTSWGLAYLSWRYVETIGFSNLKRLIASGR